MAEAVLIIFCITYLFDNNEIPNNIDEIPKNTFLLIVSLKKYIPMADANTIDIELVNALT